MSIFKIFIGIDQTGATDKYGQPKKLPCTLIDITRSTGLKSLKIHTGMYLNDLSYESVCGLIANHVETFKKQHVLICIDSAFGLPAKLGIKYQNIFSEAKNYEFNLKKYGAVTAFNFFKSISKNNDVYKRKVDEIVNANSVFNLLPFQKNIGCGTYRIIKELSKDTSWFNIWPFEKKQRQFVIAEGYPSYNWKNLMYTKTRQLSLLKKKYPRLVFKSMDHADSFLLAYGALKYQKQILQQPPLRAKKEGWILGVPFEK